MLDDYILHYPLTDFAVSLLAVAALIELGRLAFKRAAWSTAVDLLLVGGFIGALVAVGSGLWLVSEQAHAHDDLLSVHHWFAYGTLAAASTSVVAQLLQKRSPVFAGVKTVTLVIAATLVSAAGFYGGKMAHPAGEAAHNDATAHDDMIPHEGMTPAPHGSRPMTDAPSGGPPSDATVIIEPVAPDAKPVHSTTPHSH